MPPPNPQQFIGPLLQKLQQSVAKNPARGGPPSAVLTAVLDEGIAFAHERFRVGNQTRIEYFWNQGGTTGPVPPGLFGTELSATAINPAAGLDEDQVYQTLGELSFANFGYKAIAHRRSHGTHVLDLAAGYDPATAPLARPIVAIEMPQQAIADMSQTTLTPYKLLGFMYTLMRAQQMSIALKGNVPVVVSLSYGGYDGPHDGSGALESMIDRLTVVCAGSATPVRFVIAAGNHRQARVHAQFIVARRRPTTLHWRLQPDDRTPNLLQIWLPKSVAGSNQCQVRVTVTSPLGLSITVNPANLSATNPGPVVEFSASYVPETPNQRAHVDIHTEATAPAIPLDRMQPTVPPGVWRVKISHVAGKKPFACDAYIQRDETLRGRQAMGRQSYFDDPQYERHDSFGRPKEFDGPATLSYVKRTGTLNGDATGIESYVIGGYRRTPKPWKRRIPAPNNPVPTASTSEGPPAPSALRVMLAPNWLMPADDSLSCRGVLAAGTRSGVRVAMGGTSVAAPQAARYLADQFALGKVPGVAPPAGLFPVSSKVPPADRPLVAGNGCMDWPPSQTRGRP